MGSCQVAVHVISCCQAERYDPIRFSSTWVQSSASKSQHRFYSGGHKPSLLSLAERHSQLSHPLVDLSGYNKYLMISANSVANSQGPTLFPTETDLSGLSLDDDSASRPSSSSPTYSVSRAEAMFYYSGLPSNPKLVYRTGDKPWTLPRGPEAYRELKELRSVFDHKLNTAWDVLGPKVCDFLDSLNVSWTSIDVVRFVKVGEGEIIGPVVLWIGVFPQSLFGKDAYEAAFGCLGILKESGITDVEVECRESLYTSSVGPELLKPVLDFNPTVGVRGPLTPALGLSIAAQATPHAEGTGGLYLADSSDSNKLLLVTARHVLFPPNESLNANYVRTNNRMPPRDVLLLGSSAFRNLAGSIKIKIEAHGDRAELYKSQILKLQENIAGLTNRAAGEDDEDGARAREKLEGARIELVDTRSSLDQVTRAMEALGEFHKDVMGKWGHLDQRILGHIVRSPPITPGAGKEGFTEDYAVVELNKSKFKNSFVGNAIDLGMVISGYEFKSKLYPSIDASTTFKYPYDRLLKLQGIIPEEKLRSPDTLDRDGESCLFVVKSGKTSGVTIGRANGIFSYVRRYFPNNTHQTSKEWAILPYDNKSGAFSAPGDSGSIIVNGSGEIGGLLTGGAGKTEDSDVTYATPFYWLFPRIQADGFPNATFMV